MRPAALPHRLGGVFGKEPGQPPRPQDRGAGYGPRSRGAAHLPADDGGGKPGDGGLHPGPFRHRARPGAGV